jgi:hypothetical protein
MSLSQLEYLRHILDETEYLLSAGRGLSEAQFMRSETLKRAFLSRRSGFCRHLAPL